ncbi:MAG: leucine-rich repeat domain-containing protein [Bacteroidales bacterium]|jgi:hypothetical protein|nr:leucine-rich repeat domain-containing protein [Bacteroidales bacterium]
MKQIFFKTIFLSVLMCYATLATWAQTTQITTAEELAAIGKDKNSIKGSYILMNDLTLENWTPIVFNGTFNGNGHTITLSVDKTDKVGLIKAAMNFTVGGLFGEISNSGVVMNLHVTGDISCTSNFVIVAVGGIAGYNSGKIVNCISSVKLKGEGVKQSPSRAVPTATVGGKQSDPITPYDGGIMVGGIAGINQGQISNCYATGDIEVSGDGHKMGGGIAGGNGSDYIGGGLPLTGSISNCYNTGNIFVHDDSKSHIAGGIVGRNVNSLTNCVALNSRIDVSGESKKTAFNSTINATNGLLGENYAYSFNGKWSGGMSKNGYYRADIAINVEQNEKDKPSKEEPSGVAIDLAATQQQSWWEDSPKFAFGQTNEEPWIWNETLQRPVLYWEKFTVDSKSLTFGGKLTPNITWKIENETLIVSGTGAMRDFDRVQDILWIDFKTAFTSVVIENGITHIGQISFSNCKNFTSATIAESVTSIGNYAFNGCKNLAVVEVKNAVPPKINSGVFVSSPIGKAKLIVPAGAKAAYANDKNWKKFGTIEEKEAY